MTNQEKAVAPGVATKATLGWPAAIFDALVARKPDFYPRVAEGGTISTMDTLVVVQEMRAASARWPTLARSEELDAAIDLAKQSLAEVKAQTEYQDQKATRLLTVTTFLSALSGALFIRFEDAYPIETIRVQSFGAAALISGYVAFAAFIIASLSGALVTFYATRSRFKYPPYQTTEEQDKDPESLLFFGGLIRSRPRAWIKGWVARGADDDLGDNATIRDDLKQRYFQHLVGETYLVAAKTADKLRYLEPAQNILAISLRCLFVWLILLMVIAAFVPSTKPRSQPIQAALVTQATGPTKGSAVPTLAPKPADDAGQPVAVPASKGTKEQHT